MQTTLSRQACKPWRSPRASVGSLQFGFKPVPLAVPTGHGRAARSRKCVVYAIFEKFTERAIKTVMLAQREAKTNNAAEVGTEHLLLGVLAEDAGQPSFYGTGLTLEDCRAAVLRVCGRQKAKAEKAQELPFSRNSKSIFEAALLESKAMGMSFISPEHICLALLGSGNTGGMRVLRELGTNSDAVKSEALRRLKGEQDEDVKKKKPAASSKEGSKALEQFCRDLTADAASGRIDPVIGREEEINRVCQILARRRKNNPILLGEAGTGKTAIAEGLAVCIATNGTIGGLPVPAMLQGVRLMQLDIGLLLAGAKERGELESRVTKILAECKASTGSIILAIDEIHTLVGAGSVGRNGHGGGLDISNLIKPALAAGELRCIGSTTLDEHRSHIERDPALSRRFQPVIVDEPTEAAAICILEGLQARYEHHHHCSYTAAALEAAVKLAVRYIPDRFLPDKAIDIIDEAGSRARIASHLARAQRSGTVADAGLYQELLQVMDSKEEAVRAGLFEEASLLRERELGLKAQLVAPPDMATPVSLVDTPDIEKIVAMWSGVPIERMSQDDMQLLRGLPDHLDSRVIGQPDAVQAVTLALQRARCGMKDPKRPIATLLFSGPTGVGKSSLVASLAEYYFGSPDALIRLDMSEYMERHTVSKLIGSPPGYIGYGEGGKLTEAVRRRPFCLLLLDEVEKAHPDIFHMMLQVMEDGRLTDSRGRVVSFKNCLIVMTSNVGSNVIARGAQALGFQLDDGGSGAAQHARIRSLVMEELKSFFRPELLNRVDEIVVFNPLEDAHVHSIASNMLSDTVARVASLGVRVEITEAAMAAVCAQGFAIDQGARQLRRTITALVEDPLSDAILARGVAPGDTVIVDAELGKIVVITDKSDPRVAGQGDEFVDFFFADEVTEPVVVEVDA